MPPESATLLISRESAHPRAHLGSDSLALTAIYDEAVNIAIWQRQQKPALERYARLWCQTQPNHNPCAVIELAQLAQQLAPLLPELAGKSAMQAEITQLVEMFACLFELTQVGLRLTPLHKAMCPRFHVDGIPCRLVTSYGGQGTQWLCEANVDRDLLGPKTNTAGDPLVNKLTNAAAIEQLSAQAVALLKGSGWAGNENGGLVHRSPALAKGESRLLLSLDFAI